MEDLPLSPPPGSVAGSWQAIGDLEDSVVNRYFLTLNAGAFEETGTLFSSEGVMKPPFDPPLSGSAAITAYLEQEAQGMVLEPREAFVEPQADGTVQIQVKGKVHTSLFGVNVAWLFVLNDSDQIDFVTIKLLASAKELLNLRR
jgi:hypothetical protein